MFKPKSLNAYFSKLAIYQRTIISLEETFETGMKINHLFITNITGEVEYLWVVIYIK